MPNVTFQGTSTPFVEQVLDEAMALLPRELPEAERAMLRRVLREEMREDATARRLLNAARPRAAPKQSGDVPVEAARQDMPPSAARIVPLRRSGGA